MMEQLLKGIPLLLGHDYVSLKNDILAKYNMIYTGALDEYFEFDHGRLAYRGQQREHRYYSTNRFMQPVVQVNNPSPDAGTHIRSIEWKHMMPSTSADAVQGTVVTFETPCTPDISDNYEYPFPDVRNAALYRTYRRRAERIPGLILAGRLAEYRYFDMDQAIGRAMTIATTLLGTSPRLHRWSHHKTEIATSVM
jgi:UDP-galactopyranose mutase